MEQSITAIISALVGGGLTKVFDWWKYRDSKKLDEASAIRKELREEIKALRARIAVLETNLDQWKTTYYELFAEHAGLEQKYAALQEEVNDLRSHFPEEQ